MNAWGRYTDQERADWRAEYERMLALGYPWQTCENTAHTMILRRQMAAHTNAILANTDAMIKSAI